MYYPFIDDPNFNKKITQKKEFYDNRIENRNALSCLESYQLLVSNFMTENTSYNSILLFHQTGVGKTLSAISIAENLKHKYKVYVLVKNENIRINFMNELIGICSNYTTKEERDLLNSNPVFLPEQEQKAQLQKRIKTEIKKHYTFMTHEKFILRTIGRLEGTSSIKKIKGQRVKSLNNTLLIIDEIHRMIGSEGYNALRKVLPESKNMKIVLLSATPMYDSISGIFEIANILNIFRDVELPIRSALIKKHFIRKDENDVEFLTEKGKNALVQALKGKVSFVIRGIKDFPRVREAGSHLKFNGSYIQIKAVKCFLSPFQEQVYIATLDKETANSWYKKSSDALTIVYPSGKIGQQGFLSAFTGIEPKTDFLLEKNIAKYSCKLYELLGNLKQCKGSAIIYSEYVTLAGTLLIQAFLKANKFDHVIVINNEMSPTTRMNNIKKFNSDANKHGQLIKVIIGSPVIAEGLTFKNVRQIHIMEPHWNLSKIDQIIGRVIRNKSHNALPEDQRTVEIYKYVSLLKSKKYRSIDVLKYTISEKKDRSIKEVERLMKTIAFDCWLNKAQNSSQFVENGSRECEYTKCAYDCSWEPTSSAKMIIDKSTYNLKLHALDVFLFIKKKIQELFSQNFVYSLPQLVKLIKQDSEDVYIVLDEYVNQKYTIEDPLQRKGIIVYLGKGLYMVMSDSKKESYLSKVNHTITERRSLNDLLNVKEIKKEKEKLVDKELLDPDILKESIFGSYIDKIGNLDGVFRIADNRNLKESRDKRKYTTGKVCSTFSKDELKEIMDYFHINADNAKTRINMCRKIEDYMINKNLLLS